MSFFPIWATFFFWGPNSTVGSEPQHFQTLLGAPGLTPSPTATKTSRSIFCLRGVKPSAKERTRGGHCRFHHFPLFPSYPLPTQTPLFSPFKSRLSTAGEEVEVLCVITMSVPQISTKLLLPSSPCLAKGRLTSGSCSE